QIAYRDSVGDGHQDRSGPLQGAFAPGVIQAAGQDENKKYHFEHRIDTDRLVCDGEREEKDGLYVKNHEHQGEDIVLNFELPPGVADGLDAALIGAILNRIILLWTENQAVDEDW